MCGIVGYIGKKQCKPILLEGLRQLEYRGYDSAGISILGEKGIEMVKSVGKVDSLVQKVVKKEMPGVIGIAHTRWATHGRVSLKNTHPHFGCTKDIALVHNGIIENYAVLRQELKKEKHKCNSDTDTEVLVHLIEKYYTGNLLSAVIKTLRRVIGTYGIVVIHKDHPDQIIVARNGSPICIGIGKDFSLIASDVSAIVEHTDRVVYLNDAEVAVVEAGQYTIHNLEQKEIFRKTTNIEMKKESALLGDYKHFMLKEIEEQPTVIADTMRGRADLKRGGAVLGGLKSVENRLRHIKKIIIVSCGTSYHAALVGKYIFEERTDIEVLLENASEFRYKKTNADPKNTAILFISQSGETADTLAAVKESKRKGFLTLGIVNVVGSTIAREVDAGVYSHAGFEIGVASTKAFTTQLVVLILMMVYIGRLQDMSFSEGEEIIKELIAIPSKIEKFLKKEKKNMQTIAKSYAKYTNFLYLGRKYNFPIALEGALKLKEISYIHAEGYPAGEMKHGPIAMIDKDFPCFFLIPQDEVYDKVMNAIEEIKARKGKIIAVVSKGDKKIQKQVDHVITIEKTIPLLTPLLTVIPVQLFAYYVADFLGKDIDKPRNLAKSVTVE